MLGQMPAFNLREVLQVLPLKLYHPILGRSPIGSGRMSFHNTSLTLIIAIFTRIKTASDSKPTTRCADVLVPP